MCNVEEAIRILICVLKTLKYYDDNSQASKEHIDRIVKLTEQLREAIKRNDVKRIEQIYREIIKEQKQLLRHIKNERVKRILESAIRQQEQWVRDLKSGRANANDVSKWIKDGTVVIVREIVKVDDKTNLLQIQNLLEMIQ